ncbi:MAG: LssY C-terminal domain-containing protein [Nitrospiraceae bacterium]|nr:MAG: LssY C-terminal domain-containing protein [Nitrospiraceae bacterium]
MVYLCLAFLATMWGCAASFSPRPVDEVPFKTRAHTQVQGGLTVSAAVPTLEEGKEIYGVDLASKGMQAVWIQVKNETGLTYWFLQSGLDPAYFSASEASYAFRSSTSPGVSEAIDRRFQDLQFRNPIGPGATVSGFLVVNRDEGFKAVDVDLISRAKAANFTYIIPDPSFKGDFTLVDFDTLYDSETIIEIEDEDALRSEIEKFPCCTTNKKGTKQGDPLNLVLVGNREDTFPAFIRRGWHGTEIIWSKAVWRTIKSFLQGSRYRYSPVSPLYVYDRRQDLAGQKARGTIHERNHLRLWLTPLRFQGKQVWLGQISRDIGVKFTLKSPTISTHVIDPDVDEARRYLIEDLAYSQALARIGFVKGVGEVGREAPRYNLVGDPYFTDGLRAVMFFEPRPRTLGDLDIIGYWEVPARAATGEKGLFDESP